MPFSEEVTRSLRDAAMATGVELVELDNCSDSATAVRNAEELIRSRVDLIIEFNVEQEVAPVIGDKVTAANIPLVAIDIPHPNTTPHIPRSQSVLRIWRDSRWAHWNLQRAHALQRDLRRWPQELPTRHGFHHALTWLQLEHDSPAHT